VITHPAFAVEPWAVRETELDLDLLAADRVGVRALQRPHRPARQPRRGRAARPARHLPQRLLRAAPAAVRRGRLRLPRVRPDVVNVTNGKIIRLLVDDEPFDVRYGAAALATSACSTCARACCAATSSGLAGRARVRSLDAAGVVRAARGRRDPLRGRAVGRAAAVVVQSELVANEPLPAARARRPARGRGARGAAESEEHARDDTRRRARAPHRRSGCGWRPAMDHVVDGAPADIDTDREREPDLGASRSRRARARASAAVVKFLAYGWSSQRSLPGAARPGRRRARRGAHTGWDGLLAEPAREYLDDFWDARRRRARGRPELQQAVRFALFHVLQAGARAEQRAIPAKGLTGPGYDGHTFWDTETFVLPVLTYTAPARRARRAALAALDARPRASARAQLGLRGRRVPVADDPRPGVLGLLAGRHGGVPHQRRHRRRRHPLPSAPPATTEFERGRSGSSCSSRPRGCGARSATTTPRAASASTASPARTSTAPSPTTTSTRT
jgi:alpha,alpha-trehalose phosphorylase